MQKIFKTVTMAFAAGALSMTTIAFAACSEEHEHNYGDAVWIWAEDYSTATATFTCTEDDDTETVNATITSDTTPASCTAEGKTVYTATATYDGETYTDSKQVTIEKTAHTYTGVVTDSTCTQQGYTTYTCSVCEDSYVSNYVGAKGHTYGTTLVYFEGVWRKTCADCGDVVTVTEGYSDYTFLVDSGNALASAFSIGGSIKLTEDIESTAAYTVASGITATIDLNGKTITLNQDESISVLGTLVINESGDGGITIADGVTKTSLIVVNGGIVTLNGGIYNNSTYYGIYSCYGGTAIVNNGTIAASQYGALSGNNTTGDMNFEINGGTISASYGPAIYMPGQGMLTVTGGTISGGISLRMGIVTITGGTINSITDNIDSIASYYNYSGNVWLADAIYVMAGTYTSDNATYGNKLELTITGGIINCLNDQGSAVAVYDLGKVEQSVSVTISGGTLTTKSTSRSTCQVLSLSDVGVTSPASGYGTYSGFVTLTDSTKDE